jgi:aquaporin Z
MGLFSWSNIWIYLLANLAGGAAAAYTFLYLNPDDGKSTQPADLTTAASADLDGTAGSGVITGEV